MLTVNDDEHPLMKRFHRPGAEKRSVVIVRQEQYDDWLGVRSTDQARSFLNLFPANEMAALAAPKPPPWCLERRGRRRSIGCLICRLFLFPSHLNVARRVFPPRPESLGEAD